MKLTKGKLTKLYGKKRQSKKRYKKNKGETQSKTFRKRRFLDMHNRTLKHMLYGGVNTNLPIKDVTEDPLRATSNSLSPTSSLVTSSQLSSKPLSSTSSLPASSQSSEVSEQLSSKPSSSTLPLYPLSAANEQLSSEPSPLVTSTASIQTPLSSDPSSRSEDSGDIELKQLNLSPKLEGHLGELETDVKEEEKQNEEEEEEERKEESSPTLTQPLPVSSISSEDTSLMNEGQEQRESKLNTETASDGSLIALKDNIAVAPPHQQYDTDDSTFALGRAVEALADYIVKRIQNAGPSVGPLVSAAEKQAEQKALTVSKE